MILRPTLTFRWIYPVMFLAIAGGELLVAYDQLVRREDVLGALILSASAMVFIAAAVLARTAYIRVDDSTIVIGPKVFQLGRKVIPPTFDRREVARIKMTPSPVTKLTLLLRPDGSTLWTTAGTLWGRDGLKSLADYLGVPFEGWRSSRT